jgi:GNAT superfamily N-acetyltransferase
VEWERGAYRVTDDRAVLDVRRVHRWLSGDAYWARGRPLDVVRRSIDASLAFALLHGDDLVGFCRMVTDRATFAWLCDVYVDRAHRGSGAGSFLVECAVSHPDVANVQRQVLATADAHGLYERHGFRSFRDDDRDRWMIRDSTTVC